MKILLLSLRRKRRISVPSHPAGGTNSFFTLRTNSADMKSRTRTSTLSSIQRIFENLENLRRILRQNKKQRESFGVPPRAVRHLEKSWRRAKVFIDMSTQQSMCTHFLVQYLIQHHRQRKFDNIFISLILHATNLSARGMSTVSQTMWTWRSISSQFLIWRLFHMANRRKMQLILII